MQATSAFPALPHDFYAFNVAGLIYKPSTSTFVALVEANFLDYRIPAMAAGLGRFTAATPAEATYYQLRTRGDSLLLSSLVYEDNVTIPLTATDISNQLERAGSPLVLGAASAVAAGTKADAAKTSADAAKAAVMALSIPTAAQNATAVRSNLNATPIVTADSPVIIESNKLLRAGIDDQGNLTVDGAPFGSFQKTENAIEEYNANA